MAKGLRETSKMMTVGQRVILSKVIYRVSFSGSMTRVVVFSHFQQCPIQAGRERRGTRLVPSLYKTPDKQERPRWADSNTKVQNKNSWNWSLCPGGLQTILKGSISLCSGVSGRCGGGPSEWPCNNKMQFPFISDLQFARHHPWGFFGFISFNPYTNEYVKNQRKERLSNFPKDTQLECCPI